MKVLGACRRRLVLSALIAVSAGHASAQLQIRVVGDNGLPIPAVRVDVMGRGELIESVETSARGVAELSEERWSEVRRISLSHLGFQTLIVQAGDIPEDGVVRMVQEAIALEGFTVEATDPCPVVDDPRARRLWSDVAARYAQDTGSRAYSAYLTMYSGSGPRESLRTIPDDETVDFVAAGGGNGVIHGGDHAPRPLDYRLLTEGYAWPPLNIGGTRAREVAWGYPELDMGAAYHFATPTFGALHDFAVANESAGGTTLVFCGNAEGNRPTINGSITLTPGDAFQEAEWRFVTREPDEGAGGSVTFSAYLEAPGTKPHLLAARGLFYRHDGSEPPFPDLPRTYVRFGMTAARWYLLPNGEHPCTAGVGYYGARPRTPEGRRFVDCVAEHWGKE